MTLTIIGNRVSPEMAQSVDGAAGSVNEGDVPTALLAPRTKLQMKSTVFPTRRYLATCVALVAVRFVSVGVQVVHTSEMAVSMDVSVCMFEALTSSPAV